MTSRVYDFELPYTISGIEAEIGVGNIQTAGYWNVADIPQDLQDRMTAGEGLFGNGATISKDDIDRISDRAWKYIAAQLNLSWHTA
jgi:hypothetical protein